MFNFQGTPFSALKRWAYLDYHTQLTLSRTFFKFFQTFFEAFYAAIYVFFEAQALLVRQQSRAVCAVVPGIESQ